MPENTVKSRMRYALEFLRDDNELYNATRGMLDTFCNYYDVLYRNSMFMPEPEVAFLRRTVLQFGEHFMRAREAARARGMMIFKISPEVHKIQHMPMFAEALNPRWVQVY